jgi:hypothetical protein
VGSETATRNETTDGPSREFFEASGGACSALLGCLWLAVPALAARTWEQPIELSTRASMPQVKVNAKGDAVAIWERSEGKNSVIEASSRPAGGNGAPGSRSLTTATAAV